jgi:glycosyltransferase involved in cell wall biosynthesis
MSHAPALSVIVACKNPGDRLPTALASVWAQRDAALELIVVDGGSTDGTRAWLETKRTQIATLISEPDRGVYDAMNKGVAVARGEWVYFLGADDRIAGDTVMSTALTWTRQTESGVVAGEAAFADGRVYRFTAEFSPLARNFVHHQAALYRRALFAENGAFDVMLAVMADYEFNLRLWKHRVRFRPIPLRLAECGPGGLSDRGDWRGYREEIAVRHRHFPAWRCAPWDALSAARWLRKKIVRTFS